MFSIIDIAVYILLGIAGFSFLRILFWEDRKNNLFQKILGATLVLAVSIIANDSWGYAVAIIIGGLVIASEDFMKYLVAIMRTKGDMIPQTITALETRKATKEEVQNKLMTEVKDEAAITISSEGATEKKSKNPEVNERLIKTQNIEQNVQALLHQKWGKNYESQIRIRGGEVSYVFDGLIRTKGHIRKVVEIKFITAKTFDHLKYVFSRIRKKMDSIGLPNRTQLVVVLVVEDITKEQAAEIRKQDGWMAEIIFYQWKDGVAEEIILN
jgi:hypothetical protein